MHRKSETKHPKRTGVVRDATKQETQTKKFPFLGNGAGKYTSGSIYCAGSGKGHARGYAWSSFAGYGGSGTDDGSITNTGKAMGFVCGSGRIDCTGRGSL